MPTKANGLLYADYARAIKAAKKFGAKNMRIKRDGSVEFSFGDEGDELDEPSPEQAEEGPPPSPRQRSWRPASVPGGQAVDVIRDLLRSEGVVSTAQMRNALERCGYSRSTLGTALDKLKDEIVKKEPGLYAFKVKLKW
jgi:hypothetical protein